MPDFDAETVAALADDIADRCVGLHLAGVTGPEPMAKALAREAMGPDALPTPFLRELVHACLNGATWRRKLMEAKENLHVWVQKAALQATPIALHSVIFLASEANDDKRTRNSAAQFLLGAGAGLTPTQRHEVTADEEFLRLCRELYPTPRTAEMIEEDRDHRYKRIVLPEDKERMKATAGKSASIVVTEFMLEAPVPAQPVPGEAKCPDRMEGTA